MTEKRYGLTYDNQIFDNLISDPITNERAVELLNNSLKRMNALHEENQALKSDRARYEEECRLDVFKELTEENEELKKQIDNMAFILRQNGLGLMEDDD